MKKETIKQQFSRGDYLKARPIAVKNGVALKGEYAIFINYSKTGMLRIIRDSRNTIEEMSPDFWI